MMLYLLPILLFCGNSVDDTQKIVKEFHQLKSKSDEMMFIKNQKLSTNPSTLAYVISISMKQAKYNYNPYNKLIIFNENKKRLDQLIINHNSNVHLRYVRLVIQENSPSFLGYNSNINSDKSFLKEKLSISDETDYLDAYIIENTSL